MGGQGKKKPSLCDEMDWKVSAIHLIFMNALIWSDISVIVKYNKQIGRKCFFCGDAMGLMLAA